MTLPITIAWLIHQCLGEYGRRPLIGYAVASGILIYMIRISGDGVEHSVGQIFATLISHIIVKPPLRFSLFQLFMDDSCMFFSTSIFTRYKQKGHIDAGLGLYGSSQLVTFLSPS